MLELRELTLDEIEFVSGGNADIWVWGNPFASVNAYGGGSGWGGGSNGWDTGNTNNYDPGGAEEPPPPAPCEMVDLQALIFVNQTMLPTSPPSINGPIDTEGFSTENPNWRHAEYIGFLSAGGQIGPTMVEVTGRGGYRPDFSQFVGAVEGFVHNHPAYFLNSLGEFEERSDFLKADNRYPSTGDWNVLQAIADRYGATTGNINPSLYLVDPYGVAREFQLSDRAVIEALSQAQRQAGVGLDGRDVDANADSSCGG